MIKHRFFGNARKRSKRRSNCLRHRKLHAEVLETRRVLANLWITDAYLTNEKSERIEAVDEGQFVNVVILFNSSNLSAGSSYVVRRSLNGQRYDATLSWGQGISGQAGWVAFWSLGYMNAGENTVEVELDAEKQINEQTEDDNRISMKYTAPDSIDPVFINPVGGIPNRDWAIGNRVDKDPGPGFSDFRGNPYTYNGHDAQDIGLAAGWEQQKAGTPIYASSSGLVMHAIDGGDDKCGHPTANECGPDNSVAINHGGGWVTYYSHLRKGSVAVKSGEVVATGQFLGFVGSSGNSSGPHLHWAVYHNGIPIEPYERPTELLADPLPYTGEAPGIMDIYSTRSGVALDGRSEQEVFSPSESPAIWMTTQGILSGVTHDTVWYQPNGSEFARWRRREGTPSVFVLFSTLSGALGEWKVVTEVEGQKQGETSFWLSQTPRPKVKLTELASNFTLIRNRDDKSVQFDPTMPGGIGSTKTITVRNVGNSPMTISNLRIPNGFILIEPLAGEILPGREDTFTLRVDSQSPGLKTGMVQFETNDPDNPAFDFKLQAMVMTIDLTLSSSIVSENSGGNAVLATVTRPDLGLESESAVYLNSSDTSEANVPIRVTIPKGQRSISFPILIIDDIVLDGSKTVTITASLLGKVRVSRNLTVSDFENFSISIPTQEIHENAGTISATISRSNLGSLHKAVTIQLSSSNTAKLSVPSNVTIPANQSSTTFNIAVVNDSMATGPMAVDVVATAAGYEPNTKSIVVIDDEIASLTLRKSALSMLEKNGEITFTVTRNTPTNLPLEISLSNSNPSAATAPRSALIPAGSVSTSFFVRAIDNDIAEGLKTITISATSLGLQSDSTQFSIIDDDLPALTLSIAPTAIAEKGGSANALLKRNTPTTLELKVFLGSTSQDIAFPPVVTFPPGENSISFVIEAVDNSLADGNRYAILTATAVGLTSDDAEVFLLDDDAPTLFLSVSPSAISEKDGVTTVLVRRNTPVSSELMVQLTTSNTSAVTVPNLVKIPSGSETATFAISAIDNDLAQGLRNVTIEAVSTGFLSASSQLQIIDDDVAKLRITLASGTVLENNGRTHATVFRNTPTEFAQLVSVTVSGVGGSSQIQAPTSVVIEAGMSSATFEVLPIDDRIIEQDEAAIITVSSEPMEEASIELLILDDERRFPFHNSTNRLDVNDDQKIEAIDALLIINVLNREIDPTPPNLIIGNHLTPPYYDTNGDGNVWPIDALLVINFLNRRSEGEGEQNAALSDVAMSDAEFLWSLDFRNQTRKRAMRVRQTV